MNNNISRQTFDMKEKKKLLRDWQRTREGEQMKEGKRREEEKEEEQQE